MKRLAALGNDPTYLSRYVAIRNSKYRPVRPVLEENHDAIADRYQELLDRADAGDLENIGGSPLLAIRKQLRACYDIETASLLTLKKAIKDAQPARRLKYCPYCCMTKNETIDHYLPASLFPEFAVNGLNLLPCCFRCNTIKDNDWLDGAGERRYVHFYLDTVPDADFLKVDLLVQPPLAGVGARFSIDQGAIAADDWSLIERHFGRLRLLERYDEEAGVEIGEFLEVGATHLKAGGTDVPAFMRMQAVNLQEVFGRTNWRSVLLLAMANHPDLETWVAEAT